MRLAGCSVLPACLKACVRESAIRCDSCYFPFGVPDEMRARSTLDRLATGRLSVRVRVCLPSTKTAWLSRYRLPISKRQAGDVAQGVADQPAS